MLHNQTPPLTYVKEKKQITVLLKLLFTSFILGLILISPKGLMAYAAEQAAPALEKNSVELVANYKPHIIRFENIVDNARFVCSSSDDTIATVSDNGVISPVAPGTAEITVVVYQNDSEYTLLMTVTVIEPYYKVTEYSEGVHIGESITFELEQRGYTDTVRWKISGTSYARLEPVSNTKATLTGLSVGTSYITIESRNVSTTYTVRVLEGTGKVYVVSPSSLPYKSKYRTASTYNKNTKNYYMLRSYLEQLEKDGGGTLLLNSGTYTVTNILCVPSNTRVILSDGVVIDKSYITGTSALPAHRSIFQIVSYSDYNTYGGLTEYNGAHDVSIIGEGSAAINLNGLDTCAIVLCHNKNVLISGISFYDMNTNHFIELDASDNVTIRDCLFKGHVASSTGRKEAINIDNPDRETKGFNQNWTSYDGTANRNISIDNNVFIDLESAIGTHKYSEGKIHTNISITNNLFFNMKTYAIRAMNYDTLIITHNTFSNHLDYTGGATVMLLNGVTNTAITENRIENYSYLISAAHWKNSGSGSIYPEIYNVFTERDFEEMVKNYVLDVEYPYIECFETYNSNADVRYEYITGSYILDY